MHEKLIRPEHVASEQVTAARAGTARRTALFAFLALACALTLADFAQLGAHAIALGAAFLAQPFSLETLLLARVVLLGSRCEARLTRCFAASLFCFLRSHLGGATIGAHAAARLNELRFHCVAGYPNQIPYQTVE